MSQNLSSAAVMIRALRVNSLHAGFFRAFNHIRLSSSNWILIRRDILSLLMMTGPNSLQTLKAEENCRFQGNELSPTQQ